MSEKKKLRNVGFWIFIACSTVLVMFIIGFAGYSIGARQAAYEQCKKLGAVAVEVAGSDDFACVEEVTK